MKVELGFGEKTMSFAQLWPGDTALCVTSARLLMKTKPDRDDPVRVNCVELGTGELMYYPDDARVIPIQLKAVPDHERTGQ